MTEFSRPIALDTIGATSREIVIEADGTERAALARRFGWRTVERLTASIRVAARAAGVDAEGTLDAAIVQNCVVTGDPLPVEVSAPFALRFVAPELLEGEPDDEVELGGGDLDTVAHDGRVVDLGEAAAQTLALTVDPFPRGPRAEAALREAGMGDEAPSGPFAALGSLLKPRP